MKKIYLIYLLILSIYSVNSFAQSAPNLNDEEQQIRAQVIANESAQVRFLEQLVNVSSATTEIAGVYAAGKPVKQMLQTLGFDVQWMHYQKDLQRAGTLVATHIGTSKHKLLLIGHLDTVYPRNEKFSIQGKLARGAGVVDDKGGVAVMLFALQALQDRNQLKDANITIVLTGDEEDSGKPTSISRQALKMSARNHDIALDFEGALDLQSATIARRGTSHFTIETSGHAAHSATIFTRGVGDGAIFEMARILNTMREKLTSIKNISFNPGIILGGSDVELNASKTKGNAYGKRNIIASHAYVTGDFRYLTSQEKRALESQLRAIVNHHLPESNAKLSFVDGMPAMPPTANNAWLLGQYHAVSLSLNQGDVRALPAKLRGAGDISFIADSVPYQLAGLGPTGTGTHTENEHLDLASLNIQTMRAAILMYRLLQ